MSILDKSKQEPVANSTAGKGSKKSVLKELLESSRNLPQRSNELGSIQLGLNEIRRQTNGLRKNKGEQHYTKAHYLLAPSGVTVEDIESELNSIEQFSSLDSYTTTNTGTPGGGGALARHSDHQHMDLDLKAKKDENILIAIEQSLSSAARDFDNFVNQNISIDWKQRKQELRERFQIIMNRRDTQNAKTTKTSSSIRWKSADKAQNSVLNRGEFSDVKAPVLPAENLNNPNVSLALRQRFETHAEIIYDLNESRQAGKKYPISLVFSELSKQNIDVKSKQVHETWKIIDLLCNGKGEGAFRKEYQVDDTSRFEYINLNKKIVANSRRYLEQQFLDYINESYRSSVNVSVQLNPTNVEKVKFFVENKLKRNGEWQITQLSVINGIPIWAMIFYLLRAGLYEEALQVTLENRENFQKLEKTFPLYLKSYVQSNEKKLSQELHERLHAEFNQYFKHLNKESDPYRYAVYKLIGRCDLTRKNLPHITSSIEDWVWVHLCFTREDNVEDDPVHERYTLLDLQQNVVQLGSSNFNGAGNNSLYLQILAFVGLYETAVAYLYAINETDAVHLAIGLAYYGLIKPTREITDSLIVIDDKTKDGGGRVLLNFAALIISYTRSFKRSDPRIACEYLVLICLQHDLQNTELAHESLRKLVLETHEFAMLLGIIDKNGVRVPGIIEQRKSLLRLQDEDLYFSQITRQAASRADEEGRYLESILLYQLSKEYNTVMLIVNKLLGELLNVTELEALIPADEEIITVATNLSQIYNLNTEMSSKIELRNKETCSNLLKFIKLRQNFYMKNWEKCLKLVEEIDVIPISGQPIQFTQFKRLSQDFLKLDESIIRNVPNLLIIVMTCLIQIISGLNKSRYQLADAKVRDLTQMGKNCMIFAGMIEYKMPRETYSTLIELESML